MDEVGWCAREVLNNPLKPRWRFWYGSGNTHHAFTVAPWAQSMEADMNTSFRKTLGWILFSLSCLGFFLVLLVPFLNCTSAEKLAIAGGLYLVCQITWWLCVPLLGKEFMDLGRRLWGKSREKLKALIDRINS